MKVFLSYAGEDRAIAESVAYSLRGRGHKVFFDKISLPPGDSYEDRIADAVKDADVFVFLISPHSVTPGSFTLTELNYAETKWPSPARRVLPVMAVKTGYDDIPAYLKAVTVLEPKGNIATETADAVDAMRRFPIRWPIAIGLALIGVGALFGLYTLISPAPRLVLTAQQPQPWERGYFGTPGRYRIGLSSENAGGAPAHISELRLDVKPPGALVTPAADQPPGASDALTLPPGVKTDRAIIAQPQAADLTQVRWRACILETDLGEVCSPEASWQPQGDFSPATAFTLDPGISRNAFAVASTGDGFVILRGKPATVLRLDAGGAIIASHALAGEPTAFYADDTGIYVGTRGPDAIVKLDRASLAPIATAAVTFPPDRGDNEAVSSTPVEIARGGDRLWIITRGGASGAGVLHMKTDLTDPVVPPYYSDIAFDARDMVLQSDGNTVWASETNTTPASLRKLTPDAVVTYGGHDYEIASCATGVLVKADTLLVPDCEGIVQEVEEAAGALRIRSRVASLLGYKSGMSIWTTVKMRPGPGDGGALVLNAERTAEAPIVSATVNRLNPPRGLAMPLDLTGIGIVDAAFQDDVFMIIIESADGQRDTLALRYE